MPQTHPSTAATNAARIAGPALALAAGVLTDVQIVFWVLWGFDTPPTGKEAVIYGAAPATGAIVSLVAALTLVRRFYPATWGRVLAASIAAGMVLPVGYVFGLQ